MAADDRCPVQPDDAPAAAPDDVPAPPDDAPGLAPPEESGSRGAEDLKAWCTAQLARHEAYIVQHLEDMPEVRDWRLGEL